MNKELKKINSETIKIFNDFMLSISKLKNNEDIEDYLHKKSLNHMILDLICDPNPVISIKMPKDKDGNFEKNRSLSNRLLEKIRWIEQNLDIWDVTELPYNEALQQRIFEFKRKE
jgi:hypothetical protein